MNAQRDVKSVLLISSVEKPSAQQTAQEIREYLLANNIRCHHRYRGGEEQNLDDHIDLAISVGGDGTVLYASRLLSPHSIPILPINLGDFGFITEIRRDEWKEAFEQYLCGKIEAGARVLVSAKLFRDKTCIAKFIGLNDLVLSSAGVSKLIQLSVHLSSQYLGRYRADGIIVSTPTGSTAYSVAAGGPILHPEMSALILNPICPFTLSHRPLVLPGHEIIHIHVEARQRTEILLSVDGQHPTDICPGDSIVIEVSKEKAYIVRSHKRSFYEVLRSKLNWAGGPHA